MAMEEGGSNESCGSRVNENTTSPGSVLQGRQHPQRMQQKLEVYNEILRRLKESNHEEANLPGFDDQLWTHFNRLPARYVRVYVFISVSLRVCVCVCVSIFGCLWFVVASSIREWKILVLFQKQNKIWVSLF
jgi:hypothetical protein